jgi:hypothetical protein
VRREAANRVTINCVWGGGTHTRVGRWQAARSLLQTYLASVDAHRAPSVAAVSAAERRLPLLVRTCTMNLPNHRNPLHGRGIAHHPASPSHTPTADAVTRVAVQAVLLPNTPPHALLRIAKCS